MTGQVGALGLWGGTAWGFIPLLQSLALSSATGLTSHPSQRADRVPTATPTRPERALLAAHPSLDQGTADALQDCTYGRRSRKGKRDHQGPLSIFSGLSKELTVVRGGLFPLKGR